MSVRGKGEKLGGGEKGGGWRGGEGGWEGRWAGVGEDYLWIVGFCIWMWGFCVGGGDECECVVAYLNLDRSHAYFIARLHVVVASRGIGGGVIPCINLFWLCLGIGRASEA